MVARDVAAVVGLVTRQMSPEVEEALEEEKVDNGEERDWTLSFLDTLVLDRLATGKIPYKPRNLKADSVEGSSVSLQPEIGRISAGLSESISMDLSSLNSSDMFNPSRGEPATLWTLEGRLEISSSTLEISPQTSQSPKPQKLCGDLDGLLEVDWS